MRSHDRSPRPILATPRLFTLHEFALRLAQTGSLEPSSAPRRCSALRLEKRRRITRVRRIEPQEFRITHPFHPLSGREFEALAQKEYGGEHRVCFADKKGRQCEIPLSWTDLAPEDPLATLAAGKSWFRTADLLELAQLVEASRRSGPCPGNRFSEAVE